MLLCKCFEGKFADGCAWRGTTVARGQRREGLEHATGKRRRVSLRVTGHASRKLQFALIDFTFAETVPHFRKTPRTLKQTHC